jgi:molybdopterin-guanine dinucleotide biosynthesis adapter protein
MKAVKTARASGGDLVDRPHTKRALFGFVGRSGAGKTTIITDVIDCLRVDGFSVSAIKRAHDGFDLDRPGKDSWRLRESGCREVMLVGDQRWALLHEYNEQPEPDPVSIAARMESVDIVLLEGFRSAPVPSIEVHRPALGLPMLWPTCPTVVAVAADGPVECPLLTLDLLSPQSVTDFLLAHLGLESRVR